VIGFANQSIRKSQPLTIDEIADGEVFQKPRKKQKTKFFVFNGRIDWI
jgi:hypothetical protein